MVLKSFLHSLFCCTSAIKNHISFLINLDILVCKFGSRQYKLRKDISGTTTLPSSCKPKDENNYPK